MVEKLQKILCLVRNYHRHEVKGLEHIPKKGRLLLVVNHSLATYDIAMLFSAIMEENKRICRPLADRWFFKIPFISELTTAMGAAEGNPENASCLLQQEEIVAVAPGGMREALRPSSQRYQVLWDKRKGFAKVATENATPIILAVCPKADDLFDVFENPFTAWAYKKFKLPIPLIRGFGLTPFPRPVKLVHFLSEPMIPPKISPSDEPAAVNRMINKFHRKLIKRTHELIEEGIAYRG